MIGYQVDDDDLLTRIYRDATINEESPPDIGKVIGKYKIEENMGGGGSADVYRAIRNDNIHSEPVTLNIICGWGNVSELSRRMRRERKILSQFKHPNIANFLDGGYAEWEFGHNPSCIIKRRPVRD